MYYLSKKAQITLFIIIGLLIIVFIIFFFVFKDQISVNNPDMNIEEVDEVKIFMEDCLKSSLEEAVDLIMLNGGLSFFEERSYIYYKGNDFYNSSYVPYYFDVKNGENLPGISKLESDLSFLIGENAAYCFYLLNYSEEGNSNVLFDISKLSASNFKTNILKGVVKTQMYLPIYVKVKDSSFQIESFEAEVNSNYLDLYLDSIKIGEIQQENNELLCFTCVDEFSNRENISIKISHNSLDYPNYAYIYELNKFNPNRNKQEVFRFAHKFYNE
ncbi:MAG TPA: hypothetical protein P5277_04035 [Candidatus Paceibacterota bacterium]|nr:hypothetical protein [Candidatus Paceibacterota bacterium]